MQHTKSQSVFEKSKEVIPGGVNSPVRAFGGVGGTPIVMHSGSGAYLTDIDGHRYCDFVGSWGPLILGHSHPGVLRAIREASERGTSFGAPTMAEHDLAQLITTMVPSIEMVRLVNSGTEATMSAVRLARGFTGRDLIVKFDGCYHGHGDCFLIAAGSGAATLGIPDSAGVTRSIAADTLVARYNDIESVKGLFEQHPGKIAAVIVEPVAANMGVVAPVGGFLDELRSLTQKEGSLLIFDEVITGFRLAKGGAQERYNVQPDLTTLGKVIGGGLPVGAYGGRAEIMRKVAPLGPVYQAGTLAGNPISVAAGLATLRHLMSSPNLYADLEVRSQQFTDGLTRIAYKHGVPVVINRVGSLFTIFFTKQSEIRDWDSVRRCDKAAYARFFHTALEQGLYFAPSPFEAAFVSAAHSQEDIEQALTACDRALQSAA
jgi:glutamate-1-semialdehyde 2,1-aminomutase